MEDVVAAAVVVAAAAAVGAAGGGAVSSSSTNSSSTASSSTTTTAAASTSTSAAPAAGSSSTAVAADHYAKLPIAPEVVQRLIYEHLLHNCFAESARAFLASSRILANALATPQPGSATAASAASSSSSSSSTSTFSAPSAVAPASTSSSNDGRPTASMDLDGTAPVSIDGGGAAAAVVSEDAGMMDVDDADTGASNGGGMVAASSADVDISEEDDFEDGGDAPSGPAHPAAASAYLRSIDARKRLFSLVTAGKIAETIALCDREFPGALAGDSQDSVDMRFQLNCQQFIECIRESAPNALQFAQTELGRYGHLNPKYYETLQDVVALLAYKDPFNSPVADYLSQTRREEIATNLNSFILKREKLSPQSSIERIVRQVTVLRDILNDVTTKDKKNTWKVAFPKWSVSTFVNAE
ncbi:CTLH/CRA C-terminal to lish motif domain-containing protein [Zopfochytrium polystomum]|nr:CTLH/CRA C-terminal to lish motif domain-containing protein [Zopfochytrium polystomum]